MASSSVSQDDIEAEFALSSRRSRIRTARARDVRNPLPSYRVGGDTGDADDVTGSEPRCVESALGAIGYTADHDASPKPVSRTKDKRCNRSNHLNKGKQQRDRRKLREKRRSTGVVHLLSTESTGGSTGDDENGMLVMTAETKKNTAQNEVVEKAETAPTKSFTSRRTKSPSDLEADDEDNQDYDSLNLSDSATCGQGDSRDALDRLAATRPNGRPATPTGESTEELLERAQLENRRLLALLEEKDRRIQGLEQRLHNLLTDVATSEAEKHRLSEENAALVRAMASLATK